MPILATAADGKRFAIALSAPLTVDYPGDPALRALPDTISLILKNELLVRGNLAAATREIQDKISASAGKATFDHDHVQVGYLRLAGRKSGQHLFASRGGFWAGNEAVRPCPFMSGSPASGPIRPSWAPTRCGALRLW